MCLEENVVISAFGAVTPLGCTHLELLESLLSGRSGIREIKKFDGSSFIAPHAGIHPELNYDLQRTGEQLYAKLVAEKLIRHEQYPVDYYKPEQLGCIIGVDTPVPSAEFKFDELTSFSPDPTNDSWYYQFCAENFLINELIASEAGNVLNAIYKKIPFKGYSSVNLGLCAASLYSLIQGVQVIKSGELDAVIVGGISCKLQPIYCAQLELMEVISLDTDLSPEQKSRPFDRKRSGFVPAEGGVLFILERESAVKKRGAVPLLKILGYGTSFAAEHVVTPHQDSLEMKLAMQRAMEAACVLPEEIDFISAHGTSTFLNDKHESTAIIDVFKGGETPVVASKSLHGHLMAAAGAMEILMILISMQAGIIPASINCDDQDLKNCNINLIKETVFRSTNRVLKNGFGMGGVAASIVLQNGAYSSHSANI